MEIKAFIIWKNGIGALSACNLCWFWVLPFAFQVFFHCCLTLHPNSNELNSPALLLRKAKVRQLGLSISNGVPEGLRGICKAGGSGQPVGRQAFSNLNPRPGRFFNLEPLNSSCVFLFFWCWCSLVCSFFWCSSSYNPVVFFLWLGMCWVIGSLCSDLCLQFCALVFKTAVFFLCWVFLGLCFVCAPGFVLLVLQLGLQNCWPSGVSTFQLCSQFSVLPRLHFLDSRGRDRERVRVKEDIGGDRRRGGERERAERRDKKQREGKGREGIKKSGRERW